MVDRTAPDSSPSHTTIEDGPTDRATEAVFGTVDVRTDYASQVGEPLNRDDGLQEAEDRAVYAALTARHPDSSPETVDIDRPRFLIGRGSVDLSLDDPFVSDWHAQIYRREGALVLEDMDSKNGVFLRLADDLELEDGDELAMGRQRFVFRTSWDRDADATPLELGAPARGPVARLERRVEGGETGETQIIGDSVTIGREGTRLECPRDDLLADSHAVIVRDGGSFFLSDLDTETGTFIRIHNALEVVDGDRFLVGRTRIDVAFK